MDIMTMHFDVRSHGKSAMKLFAFMFGLSVAAFAQVGANVGGVVADSTGNAVPGATVTIDNTNNGTSLMRTTGPDGNYRGVNLQPAPYIITVTAPGFATSKKSVTLLVGSDQTVDFALTVGQVVQSVNVDATAVTAIEVTKSQPSSVIDDQQISALPVLDRNFLVIAQTMPGAASLTNLGVIQDFALTKFGGVADQRSGYTTILDGTPIDDAIWGTPVINESQDAIQEYKVYRDQFDAQYGNAMDAVVNVATKSGGDHFHGTAYYFGRNEALDAVQDLATTKPPFTQQRIGATIGGPVLTNKTHFFAAYENSNTNTAFIEALPASNPFASEENGNYPYTQTENLFDTRVDHRFGDKHTFWVRYAYDNDNLPTGGPANSQATQISVSKSHSLVAEDDWSISGSRVNIFGVTYLDQDLFSLPGQNTVAINRPAFNFGGDPDDPQLFPRANENVYDTYFINNARQNLEIGGGVTHSLSKFGAQFFALGDFTFTTNAPFNAADPTTWPVQFTQETSGNFHNPSYQPYGFVEDDLAVTKRLHLNLGLRYDFITNLRDNDFYYGLLKNSAFDGIQNFVSTNRGAEWSAIQPRLGVSYDVAGNGKFLLRAGAGRYVTRNRAWFQEEAEQGTIGAAVTITNPAQLSQYPNISAVLNGETLQGYVASGASRSATLIANNFRVPESLNYTAGIAWQINPTTSLEANYVTDVSSDELGGVDVNQPASLNLYTNPRPVPQFSTVDVVGNHGWATFKAFEAQLHTKTKGFQAIQVSYTYSQSLLDAVTFYGTILYQNDYAYNPTNTPHNLSAAFTTARMPGKVELSGIFTAVSGGPEPINAGIDLLGTQNATGGQLPPGLQQTVGDGDRRGQTQLINAFRANPCSFVAAGVPCNATPQPAIQQSLLNPQSVIDLDLRLTKVIPIRESKNIQLFFEGYNTFNHVTQYGGDGNLIDEDFLIRNTALPPRELQWGARFVF
jgi:hypothetical protein